VEMKVVVKENLLEELQVAYLVDVLDSRVQ
jgi:hypothetical protein